MRRRFKWRAHRPRTVDPIYGGGGMRISLGAEDPDQMPARDIAKCGSAVPSAAMTMMRAGTRSRRIIGMYVAHPVHPAGVGGRRATAHAYLAGALFGVGDDGIGTFPD